MNRKTNGKHRRTFPSRTRACSPGRRSTADRPSRTCPKLPRQWKRLRNLSKLRISKPRPNLQEPLGVRQFAKHMSVAPSSVTRWRRSGLFWERVEASKSFWERLLRDDYFEKIKSMAPDATETECFRRAFQMYAESLPERRAGNFRESGSD